eukprot:SAG31_NODE_2249_length_6085_cov_2.993819_5_plen_85_part_00
MDELMVLYDEAREQQLLQWKQEELNERARRKAEEQAAAEAARVAAEEAARVAEDARLVALEVQAVCMYYYSVSLCGDLGISASI